MPGRVDPVGAIESARRRGVGDLFVTHRLLGGRNLRVEASKRLAHLQLVELERGEALAAGQRGAHAQHRDSKSRQKFG